MRVFINNIEVNPLAGFTFEKNTNTLLSQIEIAILDFEFEDYHTIELTNDFIVVEDKEIFWDGYIHKINTNGRMQQITGLDYKGLMKDRKAHIAFPPGISVNEVLTRLLEESGPDGKGISESTGVVLEEVSDLSEFDYLFEETVKRFGDLTLKDAFDELAEEFNCIWYFLPGKKIVFKKVTELTIHNLSQEDMIEINPHGFTTEQDSTLYRNTQYVAGNDIDTQLQIEESKGNGVSDDDDKNYPLKYPVKRNVRVWVDNVEKTVGVKNLESTQPISEFLFNEGDNILTHNDNFTGIANNIVVRVEYVGKIKSFSFLQNQSEMQRVGNNLGTGELVSVDFFDNDDNTETLEELHLKSYSKLARNSKPQKMLTFTTRKKQIFEVGQILIYNEIAYFITSISCSVLHGGQINPDGDTVLHGEWTYECKQNTDKDFIDYFKENSNIFSSSDDPLHIIISANSVWGIEIEGLEITDVFNELYADENLNPSELVIAGNNDLGGS